jgi:hypothetical protein
VDDLESFAMYVQDINRGLDNAHRALEQNDADVSLRPPPRRRCPFCCRITLIVFADNTIRQVGTSSDLILDADNVPVRAADLRRDDRRTLVGPHFEHSSNAACDASNGRRGDEAALGSVGSCGAARSSGI